MGTPATTIPTLTNTDYANRMAALFPAGWASPEALSPGGAVYATMGMIGTGLAFENGALQYALAATRIQTAINGALDLASLDYFGTGLYALPRLSGETDASFAARMGPSPGGAMLQPGATRSAVSLAVQKATGFAPRLIEPWSPQDTGVWDRFFWDVDTIATPFRWTGSALPADFNLAYQGFIECVLPTPAQLGGNPVQCLDTTFFWDVNGMSLFDPSPTIPLGPEVVYAAINRAKCEGTICWVKFVSAPTLFSWDAPGINWDSSGVVWT